VALAVCCLLPSAAQAAGTATSLSLTPSQQTVVADGQSLVTETATATDANGGVQGDTISFSTSSTTGHPATLVLQSCTTDPTGTTGTCSVQLQSSTTVGEITTVTATDTTSSSAPPASATVTQIAGPAASVALQLNPTTILANGTATATATATVTDAQLHPLSGETVSFAATGDAVTPTAQSCDTTASGSCSVSFRSSTTVGSTTIDASVAGVPTPGQQTLVQSAGPAGAITLQLNPSTILADGLSMTTATATVTDAQSHPLAGETLRFTHSDPGVSILGQPIDNGDGTYTVQIRGSRTVGSSTITATDGSATGRATLIQAAGPSTTSLFASTSSPVTNQPVTLVAQVNGGTGAPSGTITFENSGGAIAGCSGEPVSPSSTVATCQTSFGAGGSPVHLAAVFVPGTGSTAPGSTGSLGLDVKPDSTSVAVSAPGSAIAKRRITYIAVVTPPSSRPGPIEPTGTVAFFDKGKPIAGCTAQPLVNSTSTCAVVYRRTGTHSITASYGGDADFTGSTSPASTLSVVKARVQIRGQLNPTMLWSFRFVRSYTTVNQLIVNGISAGDTITVTCHGRGCPFAKRVRKPATSRHCGRGRRRHRCSSPQHVDITGALRSHHLRAGATITVTITRPQWVGKSYVFRIRAGHGPRIGIGCLAPGFSKPGVGCTT
jgi:large repetitive protein